MATTYDLSTPAGRKIARKALGRRLKREDFPTTKEGWTWFCEYRILIENRNANRAKRNLEYWNRVKAGEHMVEAIAKLDATTELTAQIAAKDAELAALKAQIAAMAPKK
jgi:hypothetical protein